MIQDGVSQQSLWTRGSWLSFPWLLSLLVAGCCPTPSRVSPTTHSGNASEQPRAIESATAFVSLEGPFWVARTGHLLFSDVVEQNAAGAKIYEFNPGTRAFSVVPYPGGPITTNGLAVDALGRLIACERWNAGVAQVSADERRVLVDHGEDGQTLNAPNDLVIRADGNVYFTDTTWGAKPGNHAEPGVYRISPTGAVSRVLSVQMPNGIALSPDGNTLYVGSDTQNRLWRLPVAADGRVGGAVPFADSEPSPDARLHVPDGLCVDDRGHVYVTNNSDDTSAIIVFDQDGHYSKRIALPAPPSNCTFGGADRRTLYITTLHAVYEMRMPTPGLP